MQTKNSVSYSPKAYEDLDQISAYISQDNPAAATDFILEILDRCDSIVDAPKGYIRRDELAENIRSVAFRAYLIFYSVLDDDVRIERIIHASRDYLSDDFEL